LHSQGYINQNFIMKILKITFLFLFIATLGAQEVTTTFDQLLKEKYPDTGPGATVLIAKRGEVLYRKAFGQANLELQIPMKPENVFELGSITKQFTAVSILMLAEQGKLKTSDNIAKYLPDYPNGNQITIHHLLNHTSGIRSYTEIPDLQTFAKNDKTPIELINFFKDQEVDFQPGEQWHYNNSGYIVLGHIIEHISGMSYADFISQHIFDRLGMKNSYYGSKSSVIAKRASGYQPAENGFRNADFISMTLPYAAGSLMSCVDDMLVWHKAIRDNTLISKQSREQAFVNATLNDGSLANYGYGWQINELNGKRSIEHGGGIFGYATQGVYVPDEDIYVIVLTNANGNSPQDITLKMAAMVMDTPMPQMEQAVTLSRKQLERWTGTYAFNDNVLRFVTLENDRLYSQREGSDKLALYPIAKNQFYFEDSFTNYTFSMENGKKKAMFKDRIDEQVGIESTKKPATGRIAITLESEVLKQYEGKYTLNPGFIISITTEGDRIYAEATGQPKVEIFGEKTDVFFLKVVPAQLVFDRDQGGDVISVTLHQGGQQMKGEKQG